MADRVSRRSPAGLAKIVATELLESANVKRAMAEEMTPIIGRAAWMLIRAYRRGKKVLLIGNGGSAADAQHLAAELVGRFKMERQSLPAMALTTNTSVLTALANDYGYENVFARQIEAFGNDGDVLIAISTSGRSPNVVKAAEAAHARGMIVIGLSGGDGGQLKAVSDIAIIVPSNNTPRIQEAHIVTGHILCDLVEKVLFGESRMAVRFKSIRKTTTTIDASI